MSFLLIVRISNCFYIKSTVCWTQSAHVHMLPGSLMLTAVRKSNEIRPIFFGLESTRIIKFTNRTKLYQEKISTRIELKFTICYE